MKNKSRKIPLTVILLGVVSLVNDLSSDMILPILPLFIASIGGGAVAVGAVGSIADAFSAVLKAFSGYLSDKFDKRKPLVTAGYFVSALSKSLYALAYSWPVVFLLRIGDRVGKGIRTAPRDALVAVSVDRSIRGKAYGLHRAMDSAGAILGSVFVLILFSVMAFDLRTILMIAGPLSFLTMIPLLLAREHKTNHKKKGGFVFSLRKLPPAFKKSMVPVSIFYLGNFTYMFFILKAQQSLGGLNLSSTALVLALYIWFNVFYTASSYSMGSLSDRIGRKKTIMFGYLIFALTCLGFAYSGDLASFVFLFALYGLFNATIEGNEKALAVDLAEKQKGTAVGAFYTTEGLMMLPSGIIAGLLWEIFSPAAAFLFGAGTALLAIIAMWVLVKENSESIICPP